MLHIHPDARSGRLARRAPVTRAEIARPDEPSGVLASRYGVSTETVRKWRRRGAADCLDRSARPHRLLRRPPVAPCLPHLGRGNAWRILKAEGLRRPKPVSDRPAKDQGTCPDHDHDLGFSAFPLADIA